ncbi:MAG: hypothetical protein ACYDG5_04885 [Dehalococcoidales bacterium]
MKNKWLLLAIVVLFLSFYFSYASGNEAIGNQTIGDQATENSILFKQNQDIVLSGNITSDNQTITLRNPTFEEMRQFILKDPTNRKQFVANVFECRHFATEVDNNAKADGWRCGFALLCYAQGQHAVVAFNTVDRGLVFIEPQTDVAINVKVGGTYQGQEIKEILIAW